MYIKDPATSVGAKVDVDQHLIVRAQTASLLTARTLLGDGYNANTGTINLTSGNSSAVFYFKNNGNQDVIFDTLILLLGSSTGGAATSNWSIDVLRNPSSGTIITGAVSKSIINRNFGSSNTVDGDFFIGAEGNTVTTTEGLALESLIASPGRYAIPLGALVIPKSKSIGVTVRPPSGNTSANIQVAASLFLIDPNQTI